MKKNILKKLYGGEISVMEHIVPNDLEYHATSLKQSDLKEELKQKLMPEDREKMEDLHTLYMHTSSAYAYENFAYGVRLGAQLMMEIMHCMEGMEDE